MVVAILFKSVTSCLYIYGYYNMCSELLRPLLFTSSLSSVHLYSVPSPCPLSSDTASLAVSYFVVNLYL